MKIGFIGQGWIGKNYSDDFEERGLKVVRYSLEEPYIHNLKKLDECDIFFIAVPTPTTPKGFDSSIVENALTLIPKGKVAVIKSTLVLGTTEKLAKLFPDIYVIHNPEFLSVRTAGHDARHPTRNIIGIPYDTPEYRVHAEKILKILPVALYEKIVTSREAEMIKYGRNCLGYFRVMFTNIMYDLSQELDMDWHNIQQAMSADPDNGPTYMRAIDKSGRGAGGECFIKDFAAFADLYEELVDQPTVTTLLRTMEKMNIELLSESKKDVDLLKGVYGEKCLSRTR